MKYVLNKHQPVAEPDLMKWAAWYAAANRVVAKTYLGGPTTTENLLTKELPNVQVSTMFLGLDHSFHFGPGLHVPILFETMIFGGPLDGYQERYATWEEAEAGHAEAVRRAEALKG